MVNRSSLADSMVPRQTMIANQPHMLAYINPREEKMLRDAGGTGQAGPGGVPAYYHAAGHGEGGQKEWDERQAAANRKPLTNRYGVSLEYDQNNSSEERAYRAATAAAKASGVDLSGGPRAAGRGVGTGTFQGGVEQLYEKDGNTSSSTGYYKRLETAKDAQEKKAAETAQQNRGKPNKLGYGYFVKDKKGDDTDVWVPPSVDMRDGGGKGIAGFHFGSSGGADADKNKDGYVDENEFNTGVENGVMRRGFGAVSNATGATPLFSGRKPEGIAEFLQTGGLMGGLMGVDPPKLRANRQGQYTQADIDQYVVDREERREIDSRPDADEKLQVATLSQLESARAARDAALQSQVGNLNEAFRFANKDYYDNLSSSFKADSEGAFKTAYDASMRGLYDTYKSAGMLTQAGVDADTAALNMASTTETGNIGRLAQAYSGANENYVTSGKTTIGDALNALSSPTSDIDGLNSQTAAINAFDVAGKVQPYKSPTERSVTDFFTGFNKLSGDNSYNVAASGAGASNPSGASKSVASSGANTQPSSLVGIRSPYGGRSSRVVT